MPRGGPKLSASSAAIKAQAAAARVAMFVHPRYGGGGSSKVRRVTSSRPSPSGTSECTLLAYGVNQRETAGRQFEPRNDRSRREEIRSEPTLFPNPFSMVSRFERLRAAEARASGRKSRDFSFDRSKARVRKPGIALASAQFLTVESWLAVVDNRDQARKGVVGRANAPTGPCASVRARSKAICRTSPPSATKLTNPSALQRRASTLSEVKPGSRARAGPTIRISSQEFRSCRLGNRWHTAC